MHLWTQPQLGAWRLAGPAGRPDAGLVAAAGRRARELGTAPLPADRPILATGHQAYLWHPGILAKDLAAHIVAPRLGATGLHVVVDHDAHEALSLALPVCDGDRLRVVDWVLAPTNVLVPTGCQLPVDGRLVLTKLRDLRAELGSRLACDLTALERAWTDLPAPETLAQQITAVLARLRRGVGAEVSLVMASELLDLAPGRALVERMLADPHRCVRAYNQAVTDHPQAGMTPLAMDADRVELPLWWTAFGQPRRRVFALLRGGRTRLADDDHRSGRPPGDAAGGSPRLAPRALALTALARGALVHCFVHGRGGALYDPAMEAWWTTWTGQDLSPRVAISADLILDFDVPVSEPQDLARAAWRGHHLPHNLDRALSLDGPLAQAKRSLLAHMGDDRDRRRRARAFAELHRINHELARQHPRPLAQAQQELARTRAGLANRRVARRRDWCFALYPLARIHRLRQALEQAAPPAEACKETP